jgi:DNA-binding XRE family transcriptional regulator
VYDFGVFINTSMYFILHDTFYIYPIILHYPTQSYTKKIINIYINNDENIQKRLTYKSVYDIIHTVSAMEGGENMHKYAQRMLDYRASNKKSIETCAKEAGIATQTWRYLEKGLQSPSRVTQRKLEIYLDKKGEKPNESIYKSN